MKKRIIAFVCIAALLIVSFAALATPVAAASVLTSGHRHHLGTVMGTATITYTFQTHADWTAQHFDKLSVRIQVWVAFTAQSAKADAYVDRVHYYKILWWYIKGWDRVFHEYNTAVVHNIHGGWLSSDLTWNRTISPHGSEYRLQSTLHTVDLLLQYEDDDLTSYITPARDPIMTAG